MRTENEMFDLILGVANRDSRVRAVYMNGSRANPKAKKDIFQFPDELDRMQGRDVDFKNGYTYLIMKQKEVLPL